MRVDSIERKILIGKGFLPKELPPLFTSESFAEFIEAKHPFEVQPSPGPPPKNKKSVPVSHNLARPGNLRRKLQIPNPFNFYELASKISENWQAIQAQINRSPYSVSRPVDDLTGRRALMPQHTGNALVERRTENRAKGRFILRTDIARFYPSIYTHVIPWAFDGKEHAKVNRASGLGNELDKLVRTGQDGQTMGIPVGPDTSLVIAEAVAASLDEDLSQFQLKGFRFMDDYEFVFMSKSEAEVALGRMETSLNRYELAINPRKTRIEELPIELDYPWKIAILSFIFPPGKKVPSRSILGFFNLLFRLRKENPFEPVIPYGLSRLRSINTEEDSWPLLRNLLCQCLLVDPSCIRLAFQLIEKNEELGIGEEILNVINEIIRTHVGLGHGSEVAWALWVAVKLGIGINGSVVAELEHATDPIVRISALRAFEEGVISGPNPFAGWTKTLSRESLYDEQWILAYEANVHEWLHLKEDYVEGDDNFRLLKNAGVSFLALEDDELPEEPAWDPYGTNEYEEEKREVHPEEDEDESPHSF